MKILNTGDVTYGNSHADMINKAIGTSYDGWQKSSVDLAQFGADGVIAWFIFMDGSEHGYENGWRWKNFLSDNGDVIREYNVSPSKTAVIMKRNEEGYLPFRLCFRLDPYEIGSRHCCKFMGAFVLDSFIKEDLTAIKYIKVSDSFNLGSKGESGNYIDGKNIFLKKGGRLLKPLSELGLSDRVYRLLKSGGISFAWELLSLGMETSGEIADEIRQKLYEVFRETR